MDSLNDMTLAQLDPEIQAVLDSELERQRGTLEMIASENFVPRAVLQAQGSVLTNKYAEGYPGRRYYGGCEFVDVAESLAIERAKQVFGGDYVNVQPHAGAQANAAALMAMANVGDPILGLSLAHGGHLTHGMRLNFSGKHYKAVAYEVDRETMRIEPEKVREAALAERPRVIIAGWSAYPRHLDFQAFRDIADEVGAALWVDMAHFAGLVAGEVRHVNPEGGADLVCDIAEGLEVEVTRVGRPADDDARTLRQGGLTHLLGFDAHRLAIHLVGDRLVMLAREVQAHAVGEVATVGQGQAQDRVADVRHRQSARPRWPEPPRGAGR